MSNLDFSKFKKIAQDNKRATLVHPDGHEITIAIHGLDTNMKKKLMDLPLHQSKPEGEVEALDDDSPAEAEDAPAGQPQTAAPAPNAPAPTAPATAPAPAPAPGEPAAPAPAAPSTPSGPPPPGTPDNPNADEISVVAPPPLTPEQEAAALTQQNAHFNDDLKFGAIKPQTYHDLYENHNTLGKIGTIFALIAGGMGSGLTGQPNAALQMMDQQIKNDLDRQKTDQSNKLNWYNAALSHEKNNAEITNIYQNAVKTGSEADFSRWNNANLGIKDLSATTNAVNSMRLAVLHNNQMTIDKMPPGPARDRAQAAHQLVEAGFFRKIEQDNLDLANKKQAIATMNPAPVGKQNAPPKGDAELGKHYDAFDANKVNKALAMVASNPKAAALLNGASAEGARKEMTDLQTMRNVRADATASYKRLADMKGGNVPFLKSIPGLLAGAGTAVGAGLGSLVAPLAGTAAGATAGGTAGAFAGKALEGNLENIFERQRQQEMTSLESKMQAAGVSKDLAHEFAMSHMPTWSDSAKTQESGFARLNEYFDSRPEEAAPNLRALKAYHEPPKYNFVSPLREMEKKEAAVKKSPDVSRKPGEM